METEPKETELPKRVAEALRAPSAAKEKLDEQLAHFSGVRPRQPDLDGSTEILDGTVFTHHHVDAPGDDDTVHWHYVECGPEDGEVILFLHGIPSSWYQWYHQMAAFAHTHRCIAVDLKGYGQSETKPGNYRHEAVAEQMFTMLKQVGVKQFNAVTHDRGSVQADCIAANHPETVLRYARGEQHLYHFNGALQPQETIFRDAPWSGAMEDIPRFIVQIWTNAVKLPIPDIDMRRLIQEFWYPGISHAVPRYFNSSTFRQEWLARRKRLLAAWTCPILLIQSYDSPRQPREFYEGARDYIPNATDVQVRFLSSGHFWSMESPEATTHALQSLLAVPPADY